MTSVLNVDTIADKAGTGPVGLTKQHAAKAWCKFGNDAQPDDSFNISSTVDVQTGQWRFAKTNSMSSTDYTVVGSSGYQIASFATGFNGNAIESSTNHTQSKFVHGGTWQDFTTNGYGMHNIHGDLA